MFAIKVYDAPSFIEKIKDGKLKIFSFCFLIILIRRGNEGGKVEDKWK